MRLRDAEISQTTNMGGKNDAHLDQNINQQTNDAGTGGTQSQEGYQTASVGQVSDTGDNHAHVHQSLGQNEQINPAPPGPPASPPGKRRCCSLGRLRRRLS